MDEKNKTYTATDFERYHSGEMPADEMHSLEKAALEDPFLSDALEGYVNAPDFKADILELKARLEGKRKRKNIFSIASVAQNKWWRIAAILVIIAGVSFLFYKINFDAKEDSLATNKLRDVEKKSGSAALLKDSIPAPGDVTFQNPSAPEFARDKNSELLKGKNENIPPILNNSSKASDEMAFEKPKVSQYSQQEILSSLRPDTTGNEKSFSPEDQGAISGRCLAIK